MTPRAEAQKARRVREKRVRRAIGQRVRRASETGATVDFSESDLIYGRGILGGQTSTDKGSFGPLSALSADAPSGFIDDGRDWHGWDTDEVCNAIRWVSGRHLVSRRECRFHEHQDRECREMYEGRYWEELGPPAFPNRAVA